MVSPGCRDVGNTNTRDVLNGNTPPGPWPAELQWLPAGTYLGGCRADHGECAPAMGALGAAGRVMGAFPAQDLDQLGAGDGH